MAKAIQPYVCGGASAIFASCCVSICCVDATNLTSHKQPSVFRRGDERSACRSTSHSTYYGIASLPTHAPGTSPACVLLCILCCLDFCCAQIHPIDLVKTRLQLYGAGQKGSVRPSALTVAKGIVESNGFGGLYAGLSASVMRQAVYGTARIGLHREFSDYLKAKQGGGDLPAWKSAGSAMVSGALASIIGTPFDVSLVRMQADGMKPVAERRGYKNVFDALMRITREEGLFKLWRGFEPTAFRAVAMNVGMLASYDQAKQVISKVRAHSCTALLLPSSVIAHASPSSPSPSPYVQFNGDGVSTQLSASAISGFVCSFTSLPFDMMKTRLQNMKPDPTTGAMPYRNVMDCAGKIARLEGPLAFWTGFGAYYGRTAPHAMIILIMAEQFNRMYSEFFGLKKK